MSENDRGAAFWGCNNEWIWIIVIIVVILLLFPNILGGIGGGGGCYKD